MPEITASVKQENDRDITVTLNGPDHGSGPTLIGYLSISVVPKGVAVDGTHGKNDSYAGQLILKGERER